MTLTISLDDIYKIIDSSNPSSSKPSLLSMNSYWQAFSRWVQSQFISNRKIMIPDLGFLISVNVEQTKVIVLQILIPILEEKQIVHHEEIQQFSKPVMRLHYTGIAKMLSKNEQPEYLSYTLEKIFKTVLTLLNSDHVIIDLGFMGRITIHHKVLKIEPFLKHRKKLDGKVSVSQIVNKENSFRIKTKTKIQYTSDQFSIENIKQNRSVISGRQQFRPNFALESISSQFTKHLDMLGQTSTNEYHFSSIQPADLISTNFVKSNICEPRFPPILDSFVRTLSSPITNQKYSLSICGRIACNYNDKARSLYFDNKARCIKQYASSQGIKFKAHPTLLQPPATDTEQLLYLSQNRTQYQSKVKIRQKCFQRYNEYIINQIPHTLVRSVDLEQIKKILIKSGVNSQTAKNQKLQKIIDKNLEIIVRDYYYSIRKGILDYALKDRAERERIGIIEVLKDQQPWGTNIKKQLQFTQESKKYFKESKKRIQQHLFISKSALKINQRWGEYRKQLFVILPPITSSTNLLYFIKKQHQKIKQVRQLLRTKWVQEITSLVHEDIKEIKHKQKVTFLYKSTDTLMSNMIRSLIQQSFLVYLHFFKQFQKNQYNSAITILSHNLIQHSFLTIKLKVQNFSIVFAQNLKSHVKQQLLKLLELILEQSKNFKSLFTSTTLWSITKEDHLYQECYLKIEEIIDQNVEEIEKSLSIYQQYQYILKRQIEIQEYCQTQHTIEEYSLLLLQLSQISSTIFEHLPFVIKMNMILIDGTDLKKKYLSTIDEIIFSVYRTISERIRGKYSQIRLKIERIKQVLRNKITSPLKWLEMEEKILNIKKVEIVEIKKDFTDLEKWITFLFKEGSNLMSSQDYMRIYEVSKEMNGLKGFIEKEEQRIFNEKQEIEVALKGEISEFNENVQKLSKQLKEIIRQLTVRRQCSNYNQLLKRIAGKYEQALAVRNEINLKEKHLGWAMTQFAELEQISKSLCLASQFWNVIGTIDVRIKGWRDTAVKNIVPEELDEFLKINITKIKRMYDTDLGKEILPSEVIKEINKQLIDMDEKYMPLVRIFSNKGLKERHWEAFAKQFSICQNKQTLTLNKLITYKIHESFDKIDILSEISQSATKQFVVEIEKIKMIEEWFPIVLTTKHFQNTETLIIETQFSPLLQLLEQQLDKITKLKQLEEAKIFEQTLTQWQIWLKYTDSLLVQMHKVQNSWCQMFILFSEQEIIKNFPLEHSQFESLTNSWKSIMRRVVEQPRIVELTKNKKMLDVFLQSNMKLSVMQNTINTFIQEKDK